MEIKYCSNEFDGELLKVEGLRWFPWVGENYSTSEKRVLIIAESQYTKNDEGSDERVEEELNKYLTRECVDSFVIKKEERYAMYSNLMEFLCDRGINPTDEKVMAKIAFTNIVQRFMDYSKGKNEKPTSKDYIDGWETLVEIIKILKTTDCIVVSLTSANSFNSSMNELELDYNEVEKCEMINNAYPRKASAIIGEKDVNFIFVRHPSRGFKPEEWHDFLRYKYSKLHKFINPH